MSNVTFHGPVAILIHSGEVILGALNTHANDLKDRVSADSINAATTALAQLTANATGQKSNQASAGNSTQDEKAKLAEVQKLLSCVRSCAKCAFKGQDVMLRDAFQVGVSKPNDVASVIARSRTVLASCGNSAYSGPLAAQGWTAADTQKLSDAIAALDAADNAQDSVKAGSKGATDTRNANADTLYNSLRAIQNAANIQWPASVAANRSIRAEFLIGTFPPSASRKAKPAPVTPPASEPAAQPAMAASAK
jgi:hypothetical protein